MMDYYSAIKIMGKTRGLFKKVGDTNGIFHAKMGSIKDRNVKNVTEDIKKRWQEYIEELYKKGLNELDNYDGVATHLEPDTLECKVKWALGSITTNKTSGHIPLELFSHTCSCHFWWISVLVIFSDSLSVLYRSPNVCHG